MTQSHHPRGLGALRAVGPTSSSSISVTIQDPSDDRMSVEVTASAAPGQFESLWQLAGLSADMIAELKIAIECRIDHMPSLEVGDDIGAYIDSVRRIKVLHEALEHAASVPDRMAEPDAQRPHRGLASLASPVA